MLPLVLLAGMNCTHELWADAGLDEAIRPELECETMDEQVAALGDALPERFAIAGLSLGGIVAMELALAMPGRVAGLCLISTNAKAPTPGQLEGWQAWTDRLDAGEDPRSLQHSILPSLLSPGAHHRPDLVERVLAMGDATGAATLRAQLRMQATRVDLLGRLSSLRMPALVVSGIDDVICPPRFHTEIVDEIEGARLVSYDAGHLLPIERPHEFGRLIRAWHARLRD
ncbi:alpha/beta hydrolase [Microbacterium sp.]|uniref:alpha/beta fold hydrolase n=1 Tax=Microbacterium sp. TaxID=51671 RepID=UPI00281209D2|nr:alpha/beta hydrolase [Microbacterium sp.]